MSTPVPMCTRRHAVHMCIRALHSHMRKYLNSDTGLKLRHSHTVSTAVVSVQSQERRRATTTVVTAIRHRKHLNYSVSVRVQ